MGLFSISNCNYNKALDHYGKAKSSIDNYVVYLSELQQSIELLKEDIRRNRGTADAFVVLANIYYAIFRWDEEVNTYTNKVDGLTYLLCATALMHQWRLGWRGYNKNTNQAQIVIKMLDESLIELYPNLSSPEKNKLFWTQTHARFFDNALKLTITF